MTSYFAKLTTEKINPATQFIDECETRDMLMLINDEDQLVPLAVRKEIESIAAAVDRIYESLKDGGRMFYVGAGSSGRLGVLDASECPPTYGTAPELVQAYIAGGDGALRTAVEGCEDDADAGARLMDEKGVTSKDVVVGITASGSTPYVLGAVRRAKELGAGTVGVTTNPHTRIGEACDICIAPVVGPEVVAGSTRMKSGTAQKLVLNMLTTGVMIKLGKVYNNLMVDLRASNTKLYDRSIRMVRTSTGASEERAVEALEQANMHVKTAILMIETGANAGEAADLLLRHDGRLKAAIRAAKGALPPAKAE
ncbi:N-acetylmuramic acid 6-phosphate etherase [Paenibacillus antri]|uniref:N-acetylmuramic acid 6-phosphate etherase n=1 Tax=Paenibacillus antri TaxID=2582848 RepID=A0A5R9G386_9BACL|nr:N-acetylmuramic acid 6-phosphate etherase [Paenibacillus antri]TLS48756.1 N-acetylmuramic acid 6-phosphate etherase [Paenibacillus antri]